MSKDPIAMHRRTLLKGGAGLALAGLLPGASLASQHVVRDFHLVARRADLPIAGGAHAQTAVLAYNGAVPGPEIRVRQGERVRISVENRLAEPTTLHCHGIRLPNAMDGVPHLTQQPIAPGETFTYEFSVPDAGTFWYHPHINSAEQLARGLAGALIVEEREPLAVDREAVWLLSDWRLGRDGQIRDDFRNLHDMSHNGRIGDVVTVNGRRPEAFEVRSGERVRLRLINTANARIFALRFDGHLPIAIAYDGQPVEPHEADGMLLAPGMRADLVIDMTGRPGDRFRVFDAFYGATQVPLLDFVYAATPLRALAPGDVVGLPANPLPEPDIASALRHEVTFNGGMMGMMMGGRGGMGGMNMMQMMRSGRVWFINGVSATDHAVEPMLAIGRGKSCVLAMRNETAWHHPMHLHGHSFRVVSRNGTPTRHRPWQDTVLVAPREQVEVAFVADNPGDWMFHCHILEHQESGMMGIVRVA